MRTNHKQAIRSLRAGTDAAIAFAAFLALLFLPLLFNGHCEDSFVSYRIMWLNYLGHHFKLPMETPKPLFALVCGIVPHGLLYPVMCVAGAGVAGLCMKLARLAGASRWAGLFAFFLFVIANATVLPEFILPSYWPMLYFLFALAAVYAFAKRQAALTGLLLLLSGLMRPEAWLFPVLFILVALVKKEKKSLGWLIVPLLAPAIWALFDRRISGSFTYSADMTRYYMETVGLSPVPANLYWQGIWRNLSSSFSTPVHLLGLIACGAYAVKSKRTEHLLLAGIAAMPFVFFWVLSYVDPVIIHVRFLALSMLIFCLYASIFISTVVKQPLIRAALLAVLAAIGFQSKLFPDTFAKVKQDRMIASVRAVLLPGVKNAEKSADVIICGRSAGYFAYYLGEEASHKIFMFREIAARPELMDKVKTGLVVFMKDDCAGMDMAFRYLAKPGNYVSNGFRFVPIEKTMYGDAVVYALERIPDNATHASRQAAP